MSLDSGNVHDSVAFYHLKDYLDYTYGKTIETMVLDAGYSTASRCHDGHKDDKGIFFKRGRVL